MKLKELKEHLKSVQSDDYDVKVSSYFVKEDQTEMKYFEGDNENFIPVNDESILGIYARTGTSRFTLLV